MKQQMLGMKVILKFSHCEAEIIPHRSREDGGMQPFDPKPGNLKSVADVELPFDQIHAVITDSAAYCKKAYREVLSVFPHSIQVLCLAHIGAYS